MFSRMKRAACLSPHDIKRRVELGVLTNSLLCGQVFQFVRTRACKSENLNLNWRVQHQHVYGCSACMR